MPQIDVLGSLLGLGRRQTEREVGIGIGIRKRPENPGRTDGIMFYKDFSEYVSWFSFSVYSVHTEYRGQHDLYGPRYRSTETQLNLRYHIAALQRTQHCVLQ